MVQVLVEKYKGNKDLVYQLRHLIESEFEHLFVAAIVHGSVATDEVIPYSDFDGLLIVKDEHKYSKAFKRFIRKSMRLIYQFDPLQHHGWFIIYESLLNNYPQTYFPYELFKYARIIFPDRDITIEIDLPDKIDYTSPLKKMIASLEKKINSGYSPKNIYQVKSITSQIMLLPALYMQAKEKRGVFKKDSFELAKKDFTNEEWEAIEIASGIRLKWHYRMNRFQIFCSIMQTNCLVHKVNKKIIAPKILNSINKYLSSDFYDSVARLLTKMKKNIDEIYADR